MTTASISQMFSVLLPTIITSVIIGSGVGFLLIPGIKLRNDGLFALATNLPNAKAWEEALKQYRHGSDMISLGAQFIGDVNSVANLAQIGLGIAGFAKAIANTRIVTVARKFKFEEFVAVSV